MASHTHAIPATPHNLLHFLCFQVRAAVPQGGSERDVTTLITRPMWRAFLRAIGEDENQEPTEWLGAGKTLRVWGSRTIVVEDCTFLAISTSLKLEPKPE